MKAAVYDRNGPPDVLRYDDVPDPEVQPGGVIVEVAAVSIEGGDVLNRAGGELLSHPHIVGYQCAGHVRDVGDGVAGLSAGDAVVCVMVNGSHAELVSVPELLCWRVPDGLSIEEAACITNPFGAARDSSFVYGRAGVR